MTDSIFTKLWKLPSGNIVKFTRELAPNGEPDGETVPILCAVYVTAEKLSMKRLEVRRDWFEAYAQPA